MKKSLLLLSTLSVLSVSVHADSVPTAELKVVGALDVPTCTVTSADNGIYFVGKQAVQLIKPKASTQLASMNKTWTVTCSAATYLSFTPIDNRIKSKSDMHVDSFGLGFVNGTGKIGYFKALMLNASVDGAPAYTWSKTTNPSSPAVGLWHNTEYSWVTTTILPGQAQRTKILGRVFSADITVTPFLASAADMNGAITDATPIDGSVTLAFQYGI